MTLKTNLNEIYKKDNLFLIDRFNNKYKIHTLNNLSYIYEPHRYESLFNYYSLGINVLRDNVEI